MHRCSCHSQRGGHPSGGKAGVASVSGGSTVRICRQQDLMRRMVEG